MVDAFQGLADTVASLFGLTPVTCSATTGCGAQGAILAFGVIIVLTVIILWAMGERTGAFGIPIAATPGYIVSIAAGWLASWTVLFLVLVFAVVLVRPFGESAGG